MVTIVKGFTDLDFYRAYATPEDRILNAGSSSVAVYGLNCVNVDIQDKPGVDVVCDLHNLTEQIKETFNIVMLNAVLQYCEYPHVVAGQLYQVTKPGGYLFVDVPFQQSYCPDTTDRYRFSQQALEDIFREFEVIDKGTSIRSGSALSMLAIDIAQHLTNNRYINFIARQIATLITKPLCYLSTVDETRTAGAFYMILRKPEG